LLTQASQCANGARWPPTSQLRRKHVALLDDPSQLKFSRCSLVKAPHRASQATFVSSLDYLLQRLNGQRLQLSMPPVSTRSLHRLAYSPRQWAFPAHFIAGRRLGGFKYISVQATPATDSSTIDVNGKSLSASSPGTCPRHPTRAILTDRSQMPNSKFSAVHTRCFLSRSPPRSHYTRAAGLWSACHPPRPIVPYQPCAC
jgi:hypothetical protein